MTVPSPSFTNRAMCYTGVCAADSPNRDMFVLPHHPLCLPENQVYVKDKNVSCNQISFLGYIIITQGAFMDEGKVNAFTTWPTPAIVKELQ